MHPVRLAAALFLLPVALLAADRTVKIDRSRSYIETDVKVTVGSFTARLDDFEASMTVDEKGRIKTAVLNFRFADLHTGNPERDAAMLHWLGGGQPAGSFELGVLALAPDGQGQVSGKLTFHHNTQRLEFPVNVTQDGDTYSVVGSTTVDYRDWDLKVIKRGYVIKVAPEVHVRFKLTGTAAN